MAPVLAYACDCQIAVARTKCLETGDVEWPVNLNCPQDTSTFELHSRPATCEVGHTLIQHGTGLLSLKSPLPVHGCKLYYPNCTVLVSQLPSSRTWRSCWAARQLLLTTIALQAACNPAAACCLLLLTAAVVSNQPTSPPSPPPLSLLLDCCACHWVRGRRLWRTAVTR